MTVEKAGGYISELEFNTGEKVQINRNDIVVFVGPNNAGKSQSLKDIYTLTGKKLPSVVISNVKITKSNLPFESLLDSVSVGKKQGSYTTYSVMGHIINYWDTTAQNFSKEPCFGDFRDLFVANLHTEARLSICKAASSIARNADKQHPIHYAAFEPRYRKWLASNFKKAFGTEVIPNTQFGGQIPLCIGEPVKLEGEFEDEQVRQEAYAAILNEYKQVQNQGDGIKSFTGILLYLMLDYFCTYLIDEPESFLHPPQARIMGQIIGETLGDQQQAFISTHSEEIIKGLLDASPERIKIIRITRNGDTNAFSLLENQKFQEIWSDPLLKYSNIMTSLFHQTVVLCESDSDCKMYSIIENHIKQKQGKYSETLFIHCGGKHRMAKIAKALRSLNISIRLVPDIDVLNDESVFKGIVEAFGVAWTSVSTDYKIIISNLHSAKESVVRSVAKSEITRILDGSTTKDLSGGEISEIRNVISTESKWKVLKTSGFRSLPAGDATAAYGRLNSALCEAGIHLVPVGELECFIKTVGGHGPEWVNAVLETYPDLNDVVYTDIHDFIAGMNL